MCWDYSYSEELFSVWRHYCTNPEAPVPPTPPVWHQFSGCPGVYYPDVLSIQISNTTPGGCPCLTLTILNLPFNPAIGTYGGWQGNTTGCPGPGLTFTIFPFAFPPGSISYQMNITGPGVFTTRFSNSLCGHRFGFVGAPVNAPGICTGATLDVLAYWDWAI